MQIGFFSNYNGPGHRATERHCLEPRLKSNLSWNLETSKFALRNESGALIVMLRDRGTILVRPRSHRQRP